MVRIASDGLKTNLKSSSLKFGENNFSYSSFCLYTFLIPMGIKKVYLNLQILEKKTVKRCVFFFNPITPGISGLVEPEAGWVGRK